MKKNKTKQKNNAKLFLVLVFFNIFRFFSQKKSPQSQNFQANTFPVRFTNDFIFYNTDKKT